MKRGSVVRTVASLLATTAVFVVPAAYAAFHGITANTSNSFAASSTFPPVVSSVPNLFGTGQVGQTLQASTGTFAPTATSVAYKWLRCNTSGASCSAIGGATASSYLIASADASSTVRVEITPSNGPTPGAAVDSEPTQTVASLGIGPTVTEPTSANTPTVSGTSSVGSTLTVAQGAWSATGLTFAIQWQRCDDIGASCVNIASATGATYVLSAADQGHRIRAQITASTLFLVPNTAATATTAVIS